MKRSDSSWPIAVGLILLCTVRLQASEVWLTHLGQAERLAAKDGKDLFILFTGTSWCAPCRDLENKVLSQPPFARGVEPFVLVKLDYPNSDEELPPDHRKDFLAWRERYGIHSFPTVLLADSGGRPYATIGNYGQGAEEFVKQLDRLREVHGRRDSALAKAAASRGVEKRQYLDDALSTLRSAFDENLAKRQGDMLVRYYRPEIEQVIRLDPENSAGLRDKYRGILGADLARKHLAAIQAALDVAQTQGGAKAALKLVDQELERVKPLESRQMLQRRRLRYLGSADEFEAALKYATELSEDESYSLEERQVFRLEFAILLKRSGRIDEALAVLDRLILEVGENPRLAWNTFRLKAECLTGASRLNEALATWEAALKSVETGSERWTDTEFVRGRLLSRLGRYDDAIAAFDSLLQLETSSPLMVANYLSEKAVVLSDAGRRPEALASVERAEESLKQDDTGAVFQALKTRIRANLQSVRNNKKSVRK